MTLIEIDWTGPISLTEVMALSKSKNDIGLYMIYGNHIITRPDSLLYIGKTAESFSSRFEEHNDDWLSYESSEVKIYLGKLGGLNNIDYQTWAKQIDNAERLLIYYCSPPYNSQGINEKAVNNIKDTIVLNLGKRYRLPFEVSSFYENSEYWENENWKKYESQIPIPSLKGIKL
jgi:hypothetical protein